MIEVKENTYWNGKGKYQEQVKALSEKLIPEEDKCDSLQGEVLRAANALYYRFYNDGDMIVYNGVKPESNAEGAWGFLTQLADTNSEDEAMSKISNLTLELADSNSEDEYSEVLEKLMDECVLFAGLLPLIANEEDMLDYADDCIEECGLIDYEEEEYEEDDYDDEGNEIEEEFNDDEDDDDGWDEDEDEDEEFDDDFDEEKDGGFDEKDEEDF